MNAEEIAAVLAEHRYATAASCECGWLADVHVRPFNLYAQFEAHVAEQIALLG